MRNGEITLAQSKDIGEILIALSTLLLLWAGPASAMSYNGVESLMGRSKILELAPQNLRHRLIVQIENAVGEFIVDPSAGELVMTREFVAEHALWDYHFVSEVAGGDLVEYKSVMVGSFRLNDIRAIICDECRMLAGQSILDHFNLENIPRDGVEYLTLSK